MCGLMGWTIFGDGRRLRAAADAMAALAAARGEDSAGFAGLHGGRLVVGRWMGPLHVRRDMRRCSVVVAHARAATTGRICVEHAHPLQVEANGRHVWLVHNGSVANYRQILATPKVRRHIEDARRRGAPDAWEVDSWALAAAAAGLVSWSELRWHGTAVWMEWPARKVRMLRTDYGALEVARLPFGIVWCSWYLTAALAASGLHAEYIHVEPYVIYDVRPDGIRPAGRIAKTEDFPGWCLRPGILTTGGKK
jgi:hypothetical protein